MTYVGLASGRLHLLSLACDDIHTQHTHPINASLAALPREYLLNDWSLFLDFNLKVGPARALYLGRPHNLSRMSCNSGFTNYAFPGSMPRKRRTRTHASPVMASTYSLLGTVPLPAHCSSILDVQCTATRLAQRHARLFANYMAVLEMTEPQQTTLNAQRWSQCRRRFVALQRLRISASSPASHNRATWLPNRGTGCFETRACVCFPAKTSRTLMLLLF